jgi:threonine dehydrogenase-like Zn-dependent dehydrogenase
MCRRGLFAQCETTQVRDQGKGAALFGYTSLYGSVPGGQAEYLRVPQAQFGPVKVPDGAPDEQYLYLSDILPAAYQAVAYADVPRDGTLAVLGLGPVGQMAVRIARQLGVERVIGVDPVPERRAAAERFGAEVLDPGELDDTASALIEVTGGRGPDAVIDAVGMEAHGHDETTATRFTELAQQATGLLPDALAARVTDRIALDRLDALHKAVVVLVEVGDVPSPSPSRAKAMATARPMPLSAPVMTAALPDSRPQPRVALLSVVGLRAHFPALAGWLLLLRGLVHHLPSGRGLLPGTSHPTQLSAARNPAVAPGPGKGEGVGLAVPGNSGGTESAGRDG